MNPHVLKSYWLYLIPLPALITGCKSEPASETKKPNIIVILSDDMGYSDLGCYGGEIKTPVLDELASNGLRFTQFYNTGRCCPTRASLLSGLYPHQASIGHMVDNDDHLPGFRGDLGKDCVTFAEVLKPAGYSNYIVGKWHVTPVYQGEKMTESSKHNWPLQRGFDRFYGTIHGAGSLSKADGISWPFRPEMHTFSKSIECNRSIWVTLSLTVADLFIKSSLSVEYALAHS